VSLYEVVIEDETFGGVRVSVEDDGAIMVLTPLTDVVLFPPSLAEQVCLAIMKAATVATEKVGGIPADLQT